MSPKIVFLFLFFCSTALFAQKKAKSTTSTPKLVVGIVVDQMRYDYLYKYYDKLSDKGFKRLLREGFSFDNCQYDYMPTYTGPGHATIFTGTTPSVHGIISNDWYVRDSAKIMYCATDTRMKTIGANTSAGQKSPHQLLATTIGDELRLSNNFQSKVIGVALKDRSAVFPAGRGGNAAYWYDAANGAFVTSSYYGMTQLPEWLQRFNARKLADKYLSEKWETLLPIEQYARYCAADNTAYEHVFEGETTSSFPHDLPKIFQTSGDYEILRSTPAGSHLTKDIAIAALEGEKLGKNGMTDMLTVSFSSPDIIGHGFGPQSIEVMDCYLRLDQDIADLLTYLDQHYQQQEVLVFLTADHGAAQNIGYMKDHRLSAGSVSESGIETQFRDFSKKRWNGQDFVLAYSSQQLYLDHTKITQLGISLADVQQQFADFALQFDGVAQTITASNLRNNDYSQGILYFVQNGFYAKRSGDVALNYNPGYMDWSEIGTSHGSPFNYDTHVPLIWYGAGIPAGNSSAAVRVKDIASTVAMVLHLPFPNGNLGNPLNGYWLKRK
ncbi:MAG: alkaline phosphatase family protein [Chitinophagales bacterium]|jgi:predicted AlkP superfamily pyrophosphatase or phosphodiesterase|nr:alkaline phosphatase family protein [Chitinophagales bacterium]